MFSKLLSEARKCLSESAVPEVSQKCPRSVSEVTKKCTTMSQKRHRSVAKVRGDAEKDAKEHDMNTEHDFPVIEEP